MWQRFTERARKLVFYAQVEAQKHGKSRVNTEHLLLGILSVPSCSAAQLFVQMGVSFSEIRAEVQNALPSHEPGRTVGMSLTPQAKVVVDYAYEEARNLGHKYIGTEHVLLGLIREGDGLAARILARLGVELERIRSELVILKGIDAAPVAVSSLSVASHKFRHVSGWQRFSAGGRRAVLFGQQEADRQGISLIYPEHLLLGAIADPLSNASRLLESFGISVEAVREATRSTLVEGYMRETKHFSLSAGAKGVIDRAFFVARDLNANHFGTQHLLLAVPRDPESIGASILAKVGFSVEKAQGLAFLMTDREE